MADPVTAIPEELRPETAPPPQRERALELLRRPDFRRLFVAVCASELGDSLHYIALMWFALVAGGPLGVVAVRLADSIPAIVFGFHGGVAADRFDRKRLMVRADLVRAATLVPIAILGLTGHLPLVGARGGGVRARVGDELLRAGLRRDRAGARRAAQRPGRERR